jgi:hypothetical protein
MRSIFNSTRWLAEAVVRAARQWERFRVWVTVRLYSPWKTTMSSGQDVSEFLDILCLVKSYFSSFRRKIKKNREFFFCGAPDAQRIRRFACLQDCLLTLTWHLAGVQQKLQSRWKICLLSLQHTKTSMVYVCLCDLLPLQINVLQCHTLYNLKRKYTCSPQKPTVPVLSSACTKFQVLRLNTSVSSMSDLAGLGFRV